MIVLAGLMVVVVGGPQLAPADPLAIDPINRLQGPSRAHLFGTDHLGRDLLSRILYGARYSVAVGVTAIAVGGVVGWLVGKISEWFTSDNHKTVKEIARHAQTGAATVIIVAGVYSTIYRFTQGLGAATHLSDEFP